MNLDYIAIAKFLDKDRLNLHYLQKEATYENGNVKYIFDRCEKIEVWHNENINMITVKGSLPYWLSGHNFHSSINDWKEGLDYLQNCLNVNLYSGFVKCFEFGTIQEIPFTEALFLKNHLGIKAMTRKEYFKGKTITGKEFYSSKLKVKIYDVQRNIKNKLEKPIQEELTKLYGWDKSKHIIKVENHYKKPEAFFGDNLQTSELLSFKFQNDLKQDLISKYKTIMKTGNVILPQGKRDINAGTIPLIVLRELETVYDINIEDLLWKKLKEIPSEILNDNDRKARIKIIKINLQKIKASGKSEYDITDLLEAKNIPEEESKKTSSPFICVKKGEDILSKAI